MLRRLLNRKEKGFTIVELVIVIAVIAVLAAVLIPTFISLTAKANKAADDSLVANLNKALAIEEVDHDMNNMHDAVEGLKREGYLASTLVTKSDQKLLYDLDKNRFLLEEDRDTDKAAYKYWTIADSYDADSQNYSIYASDKFETASIANLEVGFDAGDTDVVQSISYVGKNDATQEVVIRTNGGTLNVGTSEADAAGKIVHYGTLSEAIVYTTSNSFHTHGKIASMDLKTGKAVAEDKGYVALVKAAAGTEIEEKDTGLFYIPSGTAVTNIDSDVAADLGYKSNGAEAATFVIDTTTEKGQERAEAIASTTYEISDKNELIAFRDAWNAGKLIGGKFKLTANIDISGEDWLPIGTWEYPFFGIIDGNNKTISGLTKTRLSEEDIYSTGSTTQYMGVVFGLFGITGGSDLEIKNLTLNNVNISLPVGAQVSALIGYAPKNDDFTSSSKGGAYWSTTETEGKKVLPGNYGKDDITLTNVIVNGSITAKQHVGVLIGKAYNTGELEVTNCTNNAIISANDSCAGIGGYVNGQSSVTFDGCANNGNVFANSAFAGIVNSSNTFALTVRNSSNSGTLEWLGSTYNVMSWNSAVDNADSWNFIANGIGQNAKTLENNTNTGKFVKGNIELLKAPTKGLFGYDFTDSNGHTLTLNLRNHNFTLKIDENTTYSGVWAIGSNERNIGSFMMGAKNNWNVLYAEVENVKTSEAFVLTDANSTFGNYNLSFNITGDDLALLKAIIALDGDASNDSWNLSI